MTYLKSVLMFFLILIFASFALECSHCRKEDINQSSVPHALTPPAKNLAPGISKAKFKITSIEKKNGNLILYCKMKKIYKTGPATRHMAAGEKFVIIVSESSLMKTGTIKKITNGKVVTAKIKQIGLPKSGKAVIEHEIISIESIE